MHLFAFSRHRSLISETTLNFNTSIAGFLVSGDFSSFLSIHPGFSVKLPIATQFNFQPRQLASRHLFLCLAPELKAL
jgi:hypothetical protein